MADTLENMLTVYGDRQVTVVRELTKLYEEYQRGSISELLEYLEENPLKGECLIIVEGAGEEVYPSADEVDLKAEVEREIASGIKPNQAIKEVAKRYQLKNKKYTIYIMD